MDRNKQIKKKWEITKKILEDSLKNKPYKKYLKPQPLKDNSINSVMYRMLLHAQNNPRKTNIIKLEENTEKYGKILKQFNPKSIANMTVNDIEKLLKDNLEFYPHSKTGKEYARVIKEVAEFLVPFNDANDFMRFCRLINEKVNKKFLPQMLKDIYWYGPAASRDFLKELGFECYAKPDTHVKALISHIFNCKEEDKAVLEIINKISELSKEKVYSIDKIIYLSCTHDFNLKGDEKYKDNKSKRKNNKRKENLINTIKNKLNKIR